MSRLDRVIRDVMDCRTMDKHAWIYNDNGEIRDDVICGDVIPFLEELKEYEVNVTDAWVDEFLCHTGKFAFNTYNFNACVSNDLLVYYYENDNTCIVVAAVHLFGDARCNYSDYFACRLGSFQHFLELESAYQSIEINDRFTADVSIFGECYSVYDYVIGEDVGEFCEIEKSELIDELEKRA